MDQLWTVALLLLRNAFTFCGPGEGTGPPAHLPQRRKNSPGSGNIAS